MLYRHYPRRRLASAQNIHFGFPTVVAVLIGMWTTSVLPAQSLSVKPTGKTGSIYGLVTDPKGNAVTGAKIWAIRIYSLATVSDPITATADTDAKGVYVFPALAPGSYRICVNAEGAMLLDPCTWSKKPPVWNLEGGQTAAVNLPLEMGVFVHVRVDDQNRAITKEAQSGNMLPIIISGVSSSGPRIHFEEVVSDATGRNFRALVRGADTVRAEIRTDLDVVDALGKPVNSSKTPADTTPASVTGSALEQTVRLSIP